MLVLGQSSSGPPVHRQRLGEQKNGIDLDLDKARQAHEHSLDIGFNVSATSVVLH